MIRVFGFVVLDFRRNVPRQTVAFFLKTTNAQKVCGRVYSRSLSGLIWICLVEYLDTDFKCSPLSNTMYPVSYWNQYWNGVWSQMSLSALASWSLLIQGKGNGAHLVINVFSSSNHYSIWVIVRQCIILVQSKWRVFDKHSSLWDPTTLTKKQQEPESHSF